MDTERTSPEQFAAASDEQRCCRTEQGSPDGEACRHIGSLDCCTLFDKNPLMLFIVDEQGTTLAVNERGSVQLGYTSDDLVGRPVFDIFHPEDRETVRRHIGEALMQPESTSSWELRKIRHDGTMLWVKEFANAALGVDGGRCVYIACEDITEKRRAEEALRQAMALGDALNRINTIIFSTIDFDEIMSRVITETAGATGADGAAIYMPEGDAWVARYVHGLPEFAGKGLTEEEIKYSIRAIRERRPVMINDILGDEEMRHTFVAERYGARSLLDAPLIVGKEVIGDFTLYSCRAPNAFTEQHLDFIAKVAASVSLAVSNAALFSGIKKAQERASFFASAVENSSQPFASSYPDGRLMSFNKAFIDLTGFGADELRSMTGKDLTPPEWLDHEERALEELHRTGHPQLYQKEYVRKDGSRVPVEIKAHLVSDERGAPAYLYAFITEITERKKAEDELQRANRDLSVYVQELERRNREIELLSHMGSLLQACTTNEEANSVIARMVRQIFPTEGGTVFLRNEERGMLESVARWGATETEDMFTPRECWALRLGRPYIVGNARAETLCPHVHDSLETAYICMPMIALNISIGLLYLQFDAAWRQQPEERLRRALEHKKRIAEAVAESLALSLANFLLRKELYVQSIHDPLTGLFNRRYMSEILDKELHRAQRKRQTLGLLMIDIDRFKDFNDAYGHAAGDLLLKELGKFFSLRVRAEDYACRYGGEEFLIILPETSLEGATLRAEQLRDEIGRLTIRHRGQTLGPVTLSLGVAAFPEHGVTIDELLHAADTAVYRAKTEGRNRVEVA